MQLNQYLTDTFLFNDKANKMLLEKMQQMPDPSECIKHFSHLINCQFKWMDRIMICSRLVESCLSDGRISVILGQKFATLARFTGRKIGSGVTGKCSLDWRWQQTLYIAAKRPGFTIKLS